MLNASANAVTLNSAEVKRRNAVVDGQLRAEGLRAVDVIGDGNCYFRAVSVCLYNNESCHLALRKSIVNHILELASTGNALPGVSMDVEDPSVRQELDRMMRSGTWAGEDMIAATAAFLRRPVHVYTFTSMCDASPLIYPSPAQQTADVHPIRVAFYLPGHYRAVTVNNFNVTQSAVMESKSSTLCAPPSVPSSASLSDVPHGDHHLNS